MQVPGYDHHAGVIKNRVVLQMCTAILYHRHNLLAVECVFTVQ